MGAASTIQPLPTLRHPRRRPRVSARCALPLRDREFRGRRRKGLQVFSVEANLDSQQNQAPDRPRSERRRRRAPMRRGREIERGRGLRSTAPLTPVRSPRPRPRGRSGRARLRRWRPCPQPRLQASVGARERSGDRRPFRRTHSGNTTCAETNSIVVVIQDAPAIRLASAATTGSRATP